MTIRFDYRRARSGQSGQTAEITRNLQKLERTQFEADKVSFDEFQTVFNFIGEKGNAQLRRGVEELATVSDIISLGIYNTEAGNILVASVKTDTNESKIVSISREDGSTSDLIVGVASEARTYFTSLRDILYCVNGETDIQTWDGSSAGSIGLPSGGVASRITNDTERIIVSQTNGIVRGSDKQSTGIVTTFTPSGSNLNRALIFQTQIVNVMSLVSEGKQVCIAGNNTTEIHATPNPDSGITSFPADFPTLRRSYQNLGVKTNGGVLPVNGAFLVKPQDNVLYVVSIESPFPIEIRDALGRMESLQFDKVEMVYDQPKNLVYIACRDVTTENNKILAYNIQDKTFSVFTGLSPLLFAGDSDNIYYINTFDDKVIDAFGENMLLDDGVPIEWEIRTADTYSNNLNFYKKAYELFFNIICFENTSLTAKLIADRKIGGSGSEIWSSQIDVVNNFSGTGDSPSYFGLGVWGGAGFDFGANNSVEVLDYSQKINILYERASLSLSGSSQNKLFIRGLGMSIIPTQRKFRSINMTE